ncbi:hypothetical protein EST38_g6591 [Candolleomyces aberdarensis]|uniref:Cyclin N-terminal domain-containing protein n=1 Tax=Candolleomyces aberdarensis TaxID=2316362 RepID=A0A4Q2DHE6_9AGAR|nr:hypothetical protein EST38_g6591 [Candolleomyces aberdarensis]
MITTMRPPPLIFSNRPTYATRFSDDPWAGDEDEEFPARHSARSSASSSCSHVVPESAFMGPNGRFLVDPYLGQEDAARLCTGYLIKTFNCREESEATRRLQQPTLSVFIAQLIYLTDAPNNTVISALILLQRFRAKLPSNSTSFGFSGHLLWLGAFIIACNEDSLRGAIKNARSAAYWSELTLFSEREVDEIYQELWNELDGNVTVFPSYASALEKLKHPISISPSWDDTTPQWTFDADDDCVSDTASLSELGCQRKVGAAPHTPASHSNSSSTSKPKFKPNGPTAAVSSNSSPSSLRTRAVTSRLVSFFKKKD